MPDTEDKRLSLQRCWDFFCEHAPCDQWPPDPRKQNGRSVLIALSKLQTRWSIPRFYDSDEVYPLWCLVGSGIAEVSATVTNYEDLGMSKSKPDPLAGFIASGCRERNGEECLVAGVHHLKTMLGSLPTIDRLDLKIEGFRITTQGLSIARQLAQLEEFPDESPKAEEVWRKIFVVSPIRVELQDIDSFRRSIEASQPRGFFQIVDEVERTYSRFDNTIPKYRLGYEIVPAPIHNFLPDGPLAPNRFSWMGREVELQRGSYAVVCLMWNKSYVSIDDAYAAAKDDDNAEWTDGAIKGLLKRLNESLETVNYPQFVGRSGGNLVWK